MNSDHRDNIGTHPAYSQDPETRLRARLAAATARRSQAERDYTEARNNLSAFLAEKEEQGGLTRHEQALAAQSALLHELGLSREQGIA